MNIIEPVKPEVKEVQTIEELQEEVQNKLQKITKEDVIQKVIKDAESKGRVFASPEAAKQFAEDKLNDMFNKYRLKHGLPVCCDLCGHGGGTLIKISEGKYKHKECPSDHR